MEFGEGLEVTEFPGGDAFGEWGAFGGESASEVEFCLACFGWSRPEVPHGSMVSGVL